MNILFIVCAAIFGVFLAFSSFLDIKYRKISLILLILFVIPSATYIVARLIFGFINNSISLEIIDIMLGFAISFSVSFLPALINKSTGGADIIILSSLGAFLGLNKTLILLLSSYSTAAIFGVIINILRKRKQNSEEKLKIPLIPFIFIGFLCSLFIA